MSFPMLYESASLELTLSYGIATLRFHSGASWGSVARDLQAAAGVIHRHAAVDVLVLRDFAELPGHSVITEDIEPFERTLLARAGQDAVAELEGLPIPTLAHLDGPCSGPALEIALACGWRTANGHAETCLSWPGNYFPCWGGSVRLPRLIGRARAIAMFGGMLRLTGGQAFSLGLIDRAWSPKMAEVHLLALELELQAKPIAPSPLARRWRQWHSPIRVAVAVDGSTLAELLNRAGTQGEVEGMAWERRLAAAAISPAVQRPSRAAA